MTVQMTDEEKRAAMTAATAEIDAGRADREAATRLLQSADERINAGRAAFHRAAHALLIEQHDGLGPETWPPRVAPVTCEVPACSNVATSHGTADLCIEHAAEFAAWQRDRLATS